MPDLRTLGQARSKAYTHEQSISVPTALPDYPQIVEIPLPTWVINQRNSRYINQQIKEFLANLRMALAWVFRSFERSRSEAGNSRKNRGRHRSSHVF
jgi:hypothetical protein